MALNFDHQRNRVSSSTNIVTINSTGGLTLPVGTTLARPTPAQGMVRYNTTDNRFEAYNGSVWTGLGGVVDADQNTYIIAETSSGANNNELDFYTNGVKRLQIGSAGNLIFGGASLDKFTVAYSTGNTVVKGTLTADGGITTTTTTALTLDSGTTGAIDVGTSANAKTITIGNVTGATSLVLNSGTGAINIGTSIAKTITIGNSTGASALTLDSGTGAINIGTSIAKTITIGNATGATSLVLNSGTGAINIGTSIAKTITIGNSTGATALALNSGTGNIALTATTGSVLLVATGANNITATTNGVERIRINGSGNVGIGINPTAKLDVAGDIRVNSIVNFSAEETTLATVVSTQISSFAVASFRSAKLIIQAYNSVNGEVQISELLVAHNGVTAIATEYGIVFTGTSPFVIYEVDISAGNVRLIASNTTANSTQYKISETLMVA